MKIVVGRKYRYRSAAVGKPKPLVTVTRINGNYVYYTRQKVNNFTGEILNEMVKFRKTLEAFEVSFAPSRIGLDDMVDLIEEIDKDQL